MKTDKEFRYFLIESEGFKLRWYPDSTGYPTIGIGHKLTPSEMSSGKIIIDGKPVRYANGLTEDQVNALMEQDLKKFVDCVNGSVQVSLTQNQFNALVSLAYNIGTGAFTRSTLLKLLNAGHYDLIPEQFRRWKYSGGEPVLVGRREAEIKLWNKP